MFRYMSSHTNTRTSQREPEFKELVERADLVKLVNGHGIVFETGEVMKPDKSDTNDSASPSEQKKIIQYKEPDRIRNDGTRVVIAAIEAYQRENDKTGTMDEIWSRIGKQPPTGYLYKWNSERKGFVMEDDTLLSRRSFRVRFNRLYPDAKPQ